MNLRSLFGMRRASDVLGRVQNVATALAFAGGRLTPLSGIGIAAHVAAFLVGLASKDLARVAAGWPRLDVPNELHGLVRSALVTSAKHHEDEWTHCVVDGQSVLMHMASDWVSGSFYVERDVAAVLQQVRELTWQRFGPHAVLAPTSRWCESVGLRRTGPSPAMDSDRAREVWARIAPMVRAGEPRSVLLDGPPRTGKSTIARRLLALAEAELGRPLRTLRICVSDFAYLNPGVVGAAVEMLRPDALVVDDIDRFCGADQLLDLFETVRATTRLVLATSNCSKRLPLALRLPGRIDEVLVVAGAGVELAAEVMGDRWPGLTNNEQFVVAGWPVALIRELRLRLVHGERVDVALEIASLSARAAEAEEKPTTAAAAAAPAKEAAA